MRGVPRKVRSICKMMAPSSLPTALDLRTSCRGSRAADAASSSTRSSHKLDLDRHINSCVIASLFGSAPGV